jgi:hypothetical protein
LCSATRFTTRPTMSTNPETVALVGRRKSMRVAVLGAGIMGSSLALFLARKGVEVCLLDRETVAFAGASRWNEGKIHLGYLYGADAALSTMGRVLTGGLLFGPLVSKLLGVSLKEVTTLEGDLYLIHRDSVVDADTLEQRFALISAAVREHPLACRHLVDASKAQSVRLSRTELDHIAGSDAVKAGFRTPEHSVDTRWLADRFLDALDTEALIERRFGICVTSVTPADGSVDSWRVSGDNFSEVFPVVVNALWHGRLAVDVTAGLPPVPGWSHRLRRSLFLRTVRPLFHPSATIAVGPFGDVKNYDGHRFYLSWYPAGLAAETDEVIPPEVRLLTGDAERAFVAQVARALSTLLPWTREIIDNAESIQVGGGHVFAQAQGSLSDPGADIHRRDRFGVRRLGSYFSVDTGKYSTAPWLAQQIADEIVAD